MSRSLDRAWELYWLRRYDAVARETVEHLRLHPDCVDALRLFAHAQQHLGRHEDALSTMRTAVAKDPESAVVHHSLAIVLHAMGRHGEARRACETSLRLDGHSALAWNLLASCLGAIGALRDASAAVDRALAIDTSQAEFFATKAWLCEAVGDFAGAFAAVEQGLRLDPNRLELQSRRERLLLVLGGPVRAQAAVAAAVPRPLTARERRRATLTAARMATPLGRVANWLARGCGDKTGADFGVVIGKLAIVVAAMSILVALGKPHRDVDPELLTYLWSGVLLFGANCNDVLVARHAAGRALLAEHGRRGQAGLCLVALVVFAACVFWMAARRPAPAAIWTARIGFLVLLAQALRHARSIRQNAWRAARS